MEDLRADWKSIRAKDRKRPIIKLNGTSDLHEDWVAVKGAKHPPYGFVVSWEYPSACLVWKLAIVGKKRGHAGVLYLTRGSSLFFKTPGTKAMKRDAPEAGGYERSQLCFTREEIERSIQAHKSHHLDRAVQEMRRLTALAEETRRQMGHMADYLSDVSNSPIPDSFLSRIPSRPSKKLVIP